MVIKPSIASTGNSRVGNVSGAGKLNAANQLANNTEASKGRTGKISVGGIANARKEQESQETGEKAEDTGEGDNSKTATGSQESAIDRVLKDDTSKSLSDRIKEAQETKNGFEPENFADPAMMPPPQQQPMPQGGGGKPSGGGSSGGGQPKPQQKPSGTSVQDQMKKMQENFDKKFEKAQDDFKEKLEELRKQQGERGQVETVRREEQVPFSNARPQRSEAIEKLDQQIKNYNGDNDQKEAIAAQLSGAVFDRLSPESQEKLENSIFNQDGELDSQLTAASGESRGLELASNFDTQNTADALNEYEGGFSIASIAEDRGVEAAMSRDNLDDAVEDTVQEAVENSVEESVEESIQDTVEDTVEEEVEEQIEEEIEED